MWPRHLFTLRTSWLPRMSATRPSLTWCRKSAEIVTNIQPLWMWEPPVIALKLPFPISNFYGKASLSLGLLHHKTTNNTEKWEFLQLEWKSEAKNAAGAVITNPKRFLNTYGFCSSLSNVLHSIRASASYLFQNFQTGCGAQPTSITMGIGGLFPGDKADRGWA